MAACEGVPLTHGASSAELHMPGAASFAKTASRVARASGVEIPADRAHAVEVLLTDAQAAAFGAVHVGEVAIGVEAVGQLVGQLGQLVGAVLAGQAGQLRLGCGRVSMSTKSGSRCKKLRMTVTWPAPRSPLRCAGSGGRQHRRQSLAVQRPPLAEVGGFVHTSRGFGAADPQPVGQRRGQLAAQLGRIGLLGELIDQGVFDGGLPAPHLLEVFQHGQPFGRGQHVERQVQRALVAGLSASRTSTISSRLLERMFE